MSVLPFDKPWTSWGGGVSCGELEGSSGSLDLKIEMTSATFQTCANTFEEKEVFTMFVVAASVIVSCLSIPWL